MPIENPVRRKASSALAIEPPNGRLRIGFVTSIHPDFDARVWKYAVMMAARGHAVHLVCPWDAPDGQVREGVTLHTFPRAGSRLTRPVMNPLNLARKMPALLPQVDVIHFHDIDILPWMAGLALFKPVIYDCHENYPDEMMVRQWIPRPCRRALYFTVRSVQATLSRLVKNVVFVVPEQQRDFPCDSLRTAIIRNYASLELLRRVRADYHSRPDTVVFTGSNYEANGTFLFLDIAERMLERRPAVRFVMAERWADLPTRDRALEFIRARQLRNVTVVPNVAPQNIIEHLNGATIGIAPDLRLPQRIKALPTKLFEYMAAGLPIVASNLPNSVRLAEQTGAFTLCRPEDPETFADAIETLVDDRELAHAMGQRGLQAFRDEFSWESQAQNVEDFYRRILGRQAEIAGGEQVLPRPDFTSAERRTVANHLSSNQAGSRN